MQAKWSSGIDQPYIPVIVRRKKYAYNREQTISWLKNVFIEYIDGNEVEENEWKIRDSNLSIS